MRRGLLIVVAAAALAGTPTRAHGTSQGSPALLILSPVSGSTLTAAEVTVQLRVEGAVLGGRSRNGAQVLLRLDELPPVKSLSPRFIFRGVPDGEHRIEVELRRVDGDSFDPPVQASVTFRVAASTSWR